MAMSNSVREERKKVYENLDSLLSMCNERKFDSFINETASGSIVNLDDLESVIEGKSFAYLDMPKFNGDKVSEGADFVMSLLFLSSKDCTVVEGKGHKNSFSLGFTIDSGSDDSNAKYTKFKASGGLDSDFVHISKFLGIPDKKGENEDLTIADLVAKCDADEIYSIYSRQALDIIRKYSPVAYNMFTGKDIYHRRDLLTPSGKECTLYVTYDTMMGKFRYGYNPFFILRTAIDEYLVNRKKFKSLSSCYTYCLSFFIIHEMMHLIDNNATSKGNYTEIDLGDKTKKEGAGANHTIANIVQDSYINCGVGRILSGSNELINSPGPNGIIPRIGIDSTVKLRSEHNKGFREYKSSKDLANILYDIVSGCSKATNPSLVFDRFRDEDLSVFAGADLFIYIDVAPTSGTLRFNSATFQKLINDVSKNITTGHFYTMDMEFTDSEKVSDKKILPNGSLVREKYTFDVYVVAGYDEDTGVYTLNDTNRIYKEQSQGNGIKKCWYEFEDTGVESKQLTRDRFIPYNTESDDNVWYIDDGTDTDDYDNMKLDPEEIERAKKNPSKSDYYIDRAIHVLGRDAVKSIISGGFFSDNRLDGVNDDSIVEKAIQDCAGKKRGAVRKILGEKTFSDLDKAYVSVLNAMNGVMDEPDGPDEPPTGGGDRGSSTGNNPPMPPMGGGRGQSGGGDGKVLRVGDVVFVKNAGKYGKIVSVDNGKFKIEEVVQGDPVLLDDSDNYK